jgi:tetratricopeptide (TPR) repeat protein
LVLDTPGGELLAPHVIRGIVDRGEGNPLFLHELTVAVAAAEGDELPSSLEDLLAAQIDGLTPSARKLLRSVSVLGSRFDESLALELLDEPPTPEEWSALDHFLARHADGSRRFRTGLARDAAYEGLPFRRRVELHGGAATALQKRVTEDDDQSEALSLHCLAAQRFPDAFRYACEAGRRARSLYANAAAATFFTRACIAARRASDLPAHDVACALEELGDMHARLAELPAAIDAYRAARAQAPDGSEVLRARTALGVALASARGGFPRRALRWFSVAVKDLDVTAGTRLGADELRARITVERALAHYRQGRYAEAAQLSQEALIQAEQVGAEFVIARALHMLEISEVAQGRAGDEPRVLRALALFENCGDFTRQAHMWLQLGVEAYYGGAWDRAVDCYEHARQLYEQAGDDWNMAIASANVAELLVDQGRLLQAAPLVEDALRVWRASGTPWDVGFGAALLGRLRARQGEPFEAMTLLGEAIESYSAGQEQFDLVNAELSVVETLLIQGAAAAAMQRLDSIERQLWAAWRSAARPRASGGRGSGELPADAPQTATVWRLRGYALGQIGDVEMATILLEGSLAAARGRGATHEVALALEALDWLREGTSEAGERHDLFAHLGIVWRPQIPRRAAAAEATLALVPRQRDAESDLLRSGIPAQ